MESMNDIGQVPSSEERNWATGTHLTYFLGWILPVVSVIAPLLIYLMKRDESDFIEDQARETLNFQISLLIYCCITSLLWVSIIGIPLAIMSYIFFAIFGAVVSIIAAIATSDGKHYQYPLTIRLIR